MCLIVNQYATQVYHLKLLFHSLDSQLAAGEHSSGRHHIVGEVASAITWSSGEREREREENNAECLLLPYSELIRLDPRYWPADLVFR